MNYRKGFFRIWLVFSLIWASISVILFIPKEEIHWMVGALEKRATLSVALDNIDIGISEGSYLTNDGQSVSVDELKADKALLLEQRTQFDLRLSEEMENIILFLLLMIGPIIAALLIFFAARWILIGFRTRI